MKMRMKRMTSENEDRMEEENERVKMCIIQRISTKHLNLWKRDVEKKRKEIHEMCKMCRFERKTKKVEEMKSPKRLFGRKQTRMKKKEK